MTKKQRIVQRNAYVRTSSLEMADESNRTVEFVISSEAKDSYGTIFKMDGWDLNRYAKNPIVCYQHRSHTADPDDIIGTSEVYVEDDKLIGRVTFEDADTNPKAEKVLQKVMNGTLKMASVGARVLQARYGDKNNNEDADVLYFTKSELFEWSIVTAGANPEAHKRNEQTINEIRSEATDDLNVIPTEIKTENKSVCEAQLIINKNLYNK
jgi:HK97 family phage prohead protease